MTIRFSTIAASHAPERDLIVHKKVNVILWQSTNYKDSLPSPVVNVLIYPNWAIIELPEHSLPNILLLAFDVFLFEESSTCGISYELR